MAKDPKSNQELGFLLWIKDGYINFLEGYTYGIDQWPEDESDLIIEYFHKNRIYAEIEKNWVMA